MIRGKHTMKFGGAELLRGNHTESHTFMPGRFVFGPLPGSLLSPQPRYHELDLHAGRLIGLPQVYQQGYGNPDYPAYTRPLTGFLSAGLVEDCLEFHAEFWRCAMKSTRNINP